MSCPTDQAQPARRISRFAVALVAACAMLTAIAGTASAEPVAIPGNPMTVYVGPQGQLQSFLAGGEDGIYFAPEAQLGDAGFFLAVPGEENEEEEMEPGKVWGFDGTAGPHGLEEYVPVSQGPVTGSGSAADPFSQVTEYKTVGAGEGLRVTETTTYVNGATQFMNKWVVTNETGEPATFRALAAADFYFEGDDRGTGVFTQGPPRFIGGTNVDSGRSGGFVEVLDGVSPAWSHYQELPYPNVWDEVIERAADEGSEEEGFEGEEPTPGRFDDTVDAEDVDNAGGVEWNQFETTPLPPTESATFELLARIAVPAALQLNPTNAGAPQGVPISTTATALDSNGRPYVGQTLRYAITGVNPSTGAIPLNASGQAVIVDPGTNAGGDTIAAFVDFNNNGVRDAAEPQASALATFIDNIAPSCKVKVKGDRPGGGGGAGNKLVITVNCNEPATVSVSSTLKVAGGTQSTNHNHKSHGSVAQSRKVAGHKGGKHKGGKHKAHKIKLPGVTRTVQPGAAVPIGIKVPKKIAKAYAGHTLIAQIVATVRDSAGNVSHAKSTKKIKLAKPKHKKHQHAKHGKGHGGR